MKRASTSSTVRAPRAPTVVAVVAEKGGTGKTTTAENLAVEAARDGQSVVLVDIDGQISATKWFERRQPDKALQEEENPKVISAQPARLSATVDAAKQLGATFIVIDSPGHNSPAMTAAARLADFVLVTTRPEIGDVETLGLVKDALMLGGNPPAVVNFMQAPNQGEYERLWEGPVRDEYKLDVCPVVIHTRRDFANAPVSGKTAVELDPSGKAALETRELYKFVCEQVNKFKSKGKR
jgi:chromosome partitioning protein